MIENRTDFGSDLEGVECCFFSQLVTSFARNYLTLPTLFFSLRPFFLSLFTDKQTNLTYAA